MSVYSVSVSPTTVQNVALLIPCYLGHSISVGAICDTGGETLTFNIVYTDSGGNCVGSTGPMVLVSAEKANWPMITAIVPPAVPAPPAMFLAYLQDGSEAVWHPSGTSASIVFSASSGGNWVVGAAVNFPPGVPNP